MNTIRFEVNGNAVAVEADPAMRLSQALRGELGLTGTKVGCDAGDCGACTVLIDGAPACSCLTPLGQLDGHAVITVEGLAENGTLSRLQQAFLDHAGAQCGICTPGMLVSAKALLDSNPHPSRQEVEDAMGGVLCRCTGYAKIVDAVLAASGSNKIAVRPDAGAAVGAAIQRLDGVPKVDGTERFGSDTVPEDAVSVRVIRSPHHHARFTIGDVEQFIAAHPGLIAVFTAQDIPGRNCFGVIPPFADQPVFAETTARYRGEAVAMVVGEPGAIAGFDVATFPVSWHPLPHALVPSDAVKPDAPLLHQTRAGNVLTRGLVRRGDIEAGFAAAETIVEGRYSTPFIEHAYIEPEAGHAVRVGDRIEIFASTQAPHMDRDDVAAIMGLEPGAIRIIPSACGGGFGSKLDVSMQPYVALAAWRLRRPATIVYTRQESMRSTTKRHPSEIAVRIGADRGGRITAFEFDGVFNTGAYASWGPTVANRVPVHASGPYYVPNYDCRSTAVHTHCPPSGAFRGFGVPQSAIAQECAFDELADRLGLDRLDFRLANALDNGLPTVTGQVFDKGVGIKACFEALKPRWRAALDEAAAFNGKANGSGLRRGVGIAACWYGCGNTSLPNPSTIRIGITAEGRVVLHQGATDIGQGATTVIAQIAADALGIAVHDFAIVGGDTDITPDAGKTSASRQTYVSGCAAKLSGEALRGKILRHANAGDAATIRLEPGRIVVTDGEHVREIALADLEPDSNSYVLEVAETYDPPTTPLDENGQGNPYAVFGYGAQIAEVTVDTALGTVKVERITAAHDVGRAINPQLVEGQIEGGIAQGLGLALMEEFLPGRNENLHDYLIPTFGDMPRVDSIIVEVEDGHGPYGAKGLGEHVLIPTAPAILNAIRHATGAVVRHTPATPDRVLAAIKAVEKRP